VTKFSQVSYTPPEKTRDWCTLQHYETQALERLMAHPSTAKLKLPMRKHWIGVPRCPRQRKKRLAVLPAWRP
jgi:hypothetical protein